MSGLLLQVLPFAIGAAVSPTLLTLELLVLTGKTDPKSRAWLFVAGASSTLLIFGLLSATLLNNVPIPQGINRDPVSIILKALIALVLLALGLRQLLAKPTPGERHRSRTQLRMDSAKAPVFFGVGVIGMATNLSTLVLYLPALHAIVHAPEPESTKWVVGLVLWIVTILPIVLPVLAVSALGHRSDAFLSKMNVWTTSHSRQINAGICFLFTALLGYSALQGYLG